MKKLFLLILFFFIIPKISFAAALDHEDFTGFTLGDINGQGNWTDANVGGGKKADIISPDWTLASGKQLEILGWTTYATDEVASPSFVNTQLQFVYESDHVGQIEGFNNDRAFQIGFFNESNQEMGWISFCIDTGNKQSVAAQATPLGGNGSCTGGVSSMSANLWYQLQVEFDYSAHTFKVRDKSSGSSWDSASLSNYASPIKYIKFWDEFGMGETHYIDALTSYYVQTTPALGGIQIDQNSIPWSIHVGVNSFDVYYSTSKVAYLVATITDPDSHIDTLTSDILPQGTNLKYTFSYDFKKSGQYNIDVELKEKNEDGSYSVTGSDSYNTYPGTGSEAPIIDSDYVCDSLDWGDFLGLGKVATGICGTFIPKPHFFSNNLIEINNLYQEKIAAYNDLVDSVKDAAATIGAGTTDPPTFGNSGSWQGGVLNFDSYIAELSPVMEKLRMVESWAIVFGFLYWFIKDLQNLFVHREISVKQNS